MIMKANKQIGFIYKDNESIDRILKDGDVVFERGFLREKTSTTLPITFGGVGKNLKDYKIYGNTYQNSTNGNQLIDFGEYTAKSSAITVFSFENDILTQTQTQSGTFVRTAYNILDLIKSNPQKKINFSYKSMDVTNFNSTSSVIVQLIIERSGARIYHTLLNKNGDVSSYTIPSNIDEITYASILIYTNNSSTPVSDSSFTITEPLLYFGNNTRYEPYTGGQSSPNPDYPQEIISCGDLITDTLDTNYGKYKIPINIKSENLFNMQYTNAYIGGTNARTYEDRNTVAKTGFIKCKPNTTYSIKKFENSDRFYVFDFPRIAVTNDELNPLYRNSDVSECTVTTNADAEYLYIYVSTGSGAKAPLMVVSESSIIPQKYVAYLDETKNIYLNEPLRNIKDTIYKDYIDFINQKIYRQIGETKISNYSNFSVNSVANLFVQYLTPAIEDLKLNIRDGENVFFCNYINSFGGSTASSSKIRINIPHEYLGTTSSSTPAEARIALTNLMSGKTMVFNYPLETPTEESITLPNIPTIDGNNTLNIETEITPSQVYIKYKSNT